MESIPTKITDYPWIAAINEFSWSSNFYTGKWFLFVPRDRVDEVWQEVVKTIHEDRLGPYAKVATACPNEIQNQYSQLKTDPNLHVMCIYTRDYRDDADRMRIGWVVRNIPGLTDLPMYYKRDYETMIGDYSDTCWYSIWPGGGEDQIDGTKLK